MRISILRKNEGFRCRTREDAKSTLGIRDTRRNPQDKPVQDRSPSLQQQATRPRHPKRNLRETVDLFGKSIIRAYARRNQGKWEQFKVG
jgi:hypothetical protein